MLGLDVITEVKCPAPHGAGGLKFFEPMLFGVLDKSRPARGGWIEIAHALTGGAW